MPEDEGFADHGGDASTPPSSDDEVVQGCDWCKDEHDSSLELSSPEKEADTTLE